MLVVNITTPIEKFRSVVGRFGLNEREKHLVAEVRYPGGTLGIEILFVVINLSDFDVKFNLATPLEALEKVMVIGKMNLENVDLRVGWDKVMLGFIGVWRSASKCLNLFTLHNSIFYVAGRTTSRTLNILTKSTLH